MFAVKAKIYGVLYKQSGSIAFDETSSYWSAPKTPNFLAFHWSPRGRLVSIGQHFVITMVVHLFEKDRNKLNYRIGLLRSDSVIKLFLDLITESDQAVRAVHSCNSWLPF